MSLSLAAKAGSLDQLELAHLMGLKAVRSPDALDRTDADPDRLGHGGRSPVGYLARWGTGGEVDHAGDHRSIERRLAGGACLVAQQAINAGLHDPSSTSSIRKLCFAQRLEHRNVVVSTTPTSAGDD
jgi:hypothetical protein